MLPDKRSKNEVDEVFIKDWELIEDEEPGVFYLEVFAICRIYSEVSAEECRKLLRAIVDAWLNYDMDKLGLPRDDKELRKRERQLRINRVAKDRWAWGWEFQTIANLYQKLPGRKEHRAILVIMGNAWRFESKLNTRLV